MEIGSRLKNARNEQGLTQEQVAEELGVSRQSISNWENNRAYPDIISVIRMSDLYSVSLDELLKEDKKMIEYLENATNEVKSRRSFSKLIEIGSYLVIWAISVVIFLVTNDQETMAYTILIFYTVLHVSTLVISFFIGADKRWSNLKWFMLLFFGIMNMPATFGLTILTFNGDLVRVIVLANALPGIICSAVGMGIGTVVLTVKAKKPAERSSLKRQI